MGSLTGKVVLIIGGGRGLGRVTAKKYADQGAKLVLVARTAKELNEATAEIRQDGAEVHTVTADATQEVDVARIADEAAQAFSDVDIVLNCAGAAMLKDLADTTVEDWQRIVDANFKTVFLVMREFLPGMMERKSGQIINITSRAGIHGLAAAGIYGAAKAGANFFSQVWATEAKKYGVKVLSIAPGPMDTPMRWSATPDFDPKQVLDTDGIAEFIVWLTSHPDITFDDSVIPVSINY